MIRTLIIPNNNNLYIKIPDNYIGKEIEVLLYSKDELEENKKNKSKQTIADFAGILSNADYHLLKSHTEEARKE